ncbi:hypothetical protein DFA_07875 [Cavenderia fasciculata]|uniref:SUEL-type lectin domain-containing protein n=1 Tax=Cavenderia fasciculata TaxID=261658 RepID=F4Q3S8_CACFS|nr:uncharacterized protein DFA_07875 [Cavenderia fasciculata]EGG16894.1 hypothetical protein DFA_07875 [Cavenderia fasciculata]|eukprot:XP_004355368.1 hypothetical protein DFA_07875 [Cavenderia fasciculata]
MIGHSLLVLLVALFAIVVVTSSTSTSWITIETFNEPDCDLDSSSIGGIVLQSGTCVNGQQVSCNKNVVTVQQYKDQTCQGSVGNTTEFTSGQCNTLSTKNGFYKTFTCSATTPSYPARSLAISTYSSCKANKQLELFRWIPSYKCMAIFRAAFPSTSDSASSVPSFASSLSTGTGSSGSGASSGSSGPSLVNTPSSQHHDSKISTIDILDKYFEFLDDIIFPAWSATRDVDDDDFFGASHRIGSGAGGVQTGTGFGTGTGSTAGSVGINSVIFGIVLCNQTHNSYATFPNGDINSGTGAAILSTGKYSSGDPYGSQMIVPTSSSGSGSGSSGGSGSSDQNGCSIMSNAAGKGKNVQQCYQNQLIAVTCTPPYSHA